MRNPMLGAALALGAGTLIQNRGFDFDDLLYNPIDLSRRNHITPRYIKSYNPNKDKQKRAKKARIATKRG